MNESDGGGGEEDLVQKRDHCGVHEATKRGLSRALLYVVTRASPTASTLVFFLVLPDTHAISRGRRGG